MAYRVGALALIFSIPLAAGTITTYRSLSAWTAAAHAAAAVDIQTENFEGDRINLPDLSITAPGHQPQRAPFISDGYYIAGLDRIDYVLVSFSTPMYGFGATWLYSMEGGVGIYVENPEYPSNFVVMDPPGVQQGDNVEGFAGFVSTTPFKTLWITNSVYLGEYFGMSDLVLAADPVVPEPSTLGMMLLVLILFCGTFLKKIS